MESGGGWKRWPFSQSPPGVGAAVPSPCSCSFSFFLSTLCSITLQSLALLVPSAWQMDCNRGTWPLEGSTTSLGASWTWKKGCSGRVRLWDSPAQCKVLGILRSCQQPGCEEGPSMKRKPAGEAGRLVKPDADCIHLSSGSHVSRSPGPSLIPTQLSCHPQRGPREFPIC